MFYASPGVRLLTTCRRGWSHTHARYARYAHQNTNNKERTRTHALTVPQGAALCAFGWVLVAARLGVAIGRLRTPSQNTALKRVIGAQRWQHTVDKDILVNSVRKLKHEQAEGYNSYKMEIDILMAVLPFQYKPGAIAMRS